MPLTKEDMQEINELVRDGQVEAARSILSASDDPRAQSVLNKINARYSPSAPSDEITAIKQAIMERRYDEAESLLILSDHPDAERLRARLVEVRGASKEKAASAPPVSMTGKLVLTIILLLFFAIPGLIALEIFVSEARRYPDAPGAGGLLLLRFIVRFTLFALLLLIITLVVALALTPAARPVRVR